MIIEDIKPLLKGTAELQGVMAGGVVIYKIMATDGHEYQLDIDVSNKQDVGETAIFNRNEKPMFLMRWIRKANETDTLIKLK